MGVFSIIAFENPETLDRSIKQQYGESSYQFTPTVWFVYDAGSTKSVADRVGLTDGKAGAQGVVVAFDRFSGWGPVSAWNWIARFPGVTPNG